VTISPNNPTGAVLLGSCLARSNQICRERGIYHISDKLTKTLLTTEPNNFSPGSIAEARLTRFRYSLFPKPTFCELARRYMVMPKTCRIGKKDSGHDLICAPVISQYAALGALEAGAAFVATNSG